MLSKSRHRCSGLCPKNGRRHQREPNRRYPNSTGPRHGAGHSGFASDVGEGVPFPASYSPHCHDPCQPPPSICRSHPQLHQQSCQQHHQQRHRHIQRQHRLFPQPLLCERRGAPGGCAGGLPGSTDSASPTRNFLPPPTDSESNDSRHSAHTLSHECIHPLHHHCHQTTPQEQPARTRVA